MPCKKGSRHKQGRNPLDSPPVSLINHLTILIGLVRHRLQASSLTFTPKYRSQSHVFMDIGQVKHRPSYLQQTGMTGK
jgi:hypothetical protein